MGRRSNGRLLLWLLGCGDGHHVRRTVEICREWWQESYERRRPGGNWRTGLETYLAVSDKTRTTIPRPDKQSLLILHCTGKWSQKKRYGPCTFLSFCFDNVRMYNPSYRNFQKISYCLRPWCGAEFVLFI